MKKRIVALVVVLLMVSCLLPVGAFAAETVDITILETSDLHGYIYPHDYAADLGVSYGMTKVATIIKQEREKDPNLLLTDCGDTTQDNFIQDYRFDDIHPMVKAMNFLKYDAWALGNHEFNFEFSTLQNCIEDSNATVMAGNLYKKDGSRFVDAYKIFDVKGVKVAIFSLITPNVTVYESYDPTHYDNMTFTAPIDETDKILKELEGKADVIVGLVHYGRDAENPGDPAACREIAEKYKDKIDALLIGHEHAEFAEVLPNGVAWLEPGSKGSNVGKLSIKLEKNGANWDVKEVKPELIPTKDAVSDPELEKEMQYVHDASVKTANTVVGKISENFLAQREFLPGIPTAVLEDTALIDLVNIVQMEITGADVSHASLFDSSSDLLKGDFKKKDAAKLYKYENSLAAYKITGKQLKAIMEAQAGAYFNRYREGDVTISFNPDMRMYKYDMFAGVDYEIDISKPVGSRIKNVMYKGAPLSDEQELVFAVNSYRQGGLTDIVDWSKQEKVYDSGNQTPNQIRDMISQYVAKKGTISPVCDNNWRIIGADLNDPQKDLIYEMIRKGEIQIPKSEDDRTFNVASINANDLREKGIIPALPEEELGPRITKIAALGHGSVFEVKETAQLEAVYEPMDASTNDISWSSSNPSIISIDNDGKVTAHKKGEAYITVSSHNVVKIYKVTVVNENVAEKPAA